MLCTRARERLQIEFLYINGGRLLVVRIIWMLKCFSDLSERDDTELFIRCFLSAVCGH